MRVTYRTSAKTEIKTIDFCCSEMSDFVLNKAREYVGERETQRIYFLGDDLVTLGSTKISFCPFCGCKIEHEYIVGSYHV